GNNLEEMNAEGTGIALVETVEDMPTADIFGNIIGVDATVSVPLPNGIGIAAAVGDNGLQIGGSNPGLGNIISGNSGLGIPAGNRGPTVLIQGNIIGTDGSGSRNLGNRAGGIVVGAVHDG